MPPRQRRREPREKPLSQLLLEADLKGDWWSDEALHNLLGTDRDAVAEVFRRAADDDGVVDGKLKRIHFKDEDGEHHWLYFRRPLDYQECDKKTRGSMKQAGGTVYVFPHGPKRWKDIKGGRWTPTLLSKRAAPPLSPPRIDNNTDAIIVSDRAPPPAKKYDADYDDDESEDEVAALLPRRQTTGELRLEIMELKSQLRKHVNLEKRNHALESEVSRLRNRLKDKDDPRDFTDEAARRDAQEARHEKPERRSDAWCERIMNVNRALRHGFVACFRPRVIADLVAASSDYMRSVLSTRGAASRIVLALGRAFRDAEADPVVAERVFVASKRVGIGVRKSARLARRWSG